MFKKRILISLCLALLVGCGTGDDFEILLPPEEPTNAIGVVKKDGQDKITVDTSQSGKIRYLGEIENKGKQKFCFINISFVTRDADNAIIDKNQKPRASLIGTTLSLGGIEYHDCLNPGESGSFDTGYQPIFGIFKHYEFRICENPNGVDIGCRSNPSATSPLVPLELDIQTIGKDANDKRIFNGFVINRAASNLFAYDVTVVFTILDQEGNVIDTKEESVPTLGPCVINGTDVTNCIKPGDTAPFATTTDTLAERTCILRSCFYYRIHHSE